MLQKRCLNEREAQPKKVKNTFRQKRRQEKRKSPQKNREKLPKKERKTSLIKSTKGRYRWVTTKNLGVKKRIRARKDNSGKKRCREKSLKVNKMKGST